MAGYSEVTLKLKKEVTQPGVSVRLLLVLSLESRWKCNKNTALTSGGWAFVMFSFPWIFFFAISLSLETRFLVFVTSKWNSIFPFHVRSGSHLYRVFDPRPASYLEHWLTCPWNLFNSCIPFTCLDIPAVLWFLLLCFPFSVPQSIFRSLPFSSVTRSSSFEETPKPELEKKHYCLLYSCKCVYIYIAWLKLLWVKKNIVVLHNKLFKWQWILHYNTKK